MFLNRLTRGSKIGEEKRVFKVGKISAKNDVLTVQEKQRAHRVNTTKRGLETNPRKREIESQRSKAPKTRMNKRVGKEKELLSDIRREIC